jgi:large subunit ribosomal protein L32
MAVHKSRVTRSRRGQRRAHSALSNPTFSIEQSTGDIHLRHHITPSGCYRGKRVIALKPKKATDNAAASSAEQGQ